MRIIFVALLHSYFENSSSHRIGAIITYNVLWGITLVSWLLLIVLGIKALSFLLLSLAHFRKSRNLVEHQQGAYTPLVSVIVPCYNEEVVLANCVCSLQAQTYKNIEIILVDDGSRDRTAEIGLNLLWEAGGNVRFYVKPNGGKASALNFGISQASGEIVVSMDADSVFMPDTIEQLVRPFADPEIAAVGGNVKVANRRSILARHQAAEYISGLTLQRRAFAYLGCMQVISGAIGAFRRDHLREIGGYPTDTVVEDMDVTISLARAGYHVDYNAQAVAYTEAPESVKDFLKQRYRWTYGGFQVLRKHRDMLFNPKYKTMGLIGKPYFLIFPWVDAFISLLFLVVVYRVLFVGGIADLILFYIAMAAFQGLLMTYSLVMDKEHISLATLSGIEGLWYNHLIAFTTLKAGINSVRGTGTSWNKLARLGKNLTPSTKQHKRATSECPAC